MWYLMYYFIDPQGCMADLLCRAKYKWRDTVFWLCTAELTITDRPPSKHEALNQSWGNVGPPSTTSSQHWPNIDSMPRVCWAWDICELEYMMHREQIPNLGVICRVWANSLVTRTNRFLPLCTISVVINRSINTEVRTHHAESMHTKSRTIG